MIFSELTSASPTPSLAKIELKLIESEAQREVKFILNNKIIVIVVDNNFVVNWFEESNILVDQ